VAEEQLVFAFHDDTMFAFERSPRHSASSFGGPLEANLSGIEHGPNPLHLIARLGGLHIPTLSNHYLLDLPLIYGLTYSGCDLEYRVTPGGIELLKLRPTESSDDFPYWHFPPLLPYVPLRLSDLPRRVSYQEFAAPFPNMPAAQPAELVVAVPPPATVGVSLWGPAHGDGDGVTIVFECDLQDKTVGAYNVTS
jgi:hypothetical protein